MKHQSQELGPLDTASCELSNKAIMFLQGDKV